MEEKTIFEGLIEEANRVKQEHSEAHLMMLMVEGYVVKSRAGCRLNGNKGILTIALAECMKKDRDLEEIVMDAILLLSSIK